VPVATPDKNDATVSLLRIARQESAAAGELARLATSRVWLGAGIPHGDGRPVLLIPGLGTVDASLELLRRWLRLRGYRTHRARGGVNTSCSERACARLETRLELIAAAASAPVAVVGHSRGGLLAKAVATARPDLVSGIVTLGSPTVLGDGPPTRHPTTRALRFVLRTGHLPNALSPRCLARRCGTRYATAMRAPLPEGIGYVSIYSRNDSVVPWQHCLNPAAHNVEVRSTHIGMAYNAAVYAEVGRALGTFGPRPQDRSWRGRIVGGTMAAGRALAPR
jgi:triacylglycerol lipase